MKETTPKEGSKPRLDADSFQQLLAAAHVLQEHNDRQNAAQSNETETQKPSQPESGQSPAASPVMEPAIPPDYTKTLAEIVATQHQIQMSHYDFEDAMNLVAERTQKIAEADASVIGLLEQDELVYQAASGSAAHLLGAKVRASACLSMGCLLHGATVQCPDVRKEPSLGPDFCREFGIEALIAVPIFYEGNVIGSLEVHFASANAFQEHNIRTCQLMAGLVTEAKARSAEAEWKQALAAERATMLEALEKLKPQLQRLANDPETDRSQSEPSARGERAERAQPEVEAGAAQPGMGFSIKQATCSGCGNPLEPAQIFCGVCGTERNQPPADNIQSKWASMWHLSQARLEKEQAESVLPQHEVVLPELHRHNHDEDSDFILPEKAAGTVHREHAAVAKQLAGATETDELSGVTEPAALPWPGMEQDEAADHDGEHDQPVETDGAADEHSEGTAVERSGPQSPWQSATDPEQEWLKEVEDLKEGGALLRFVKARRADIYLAAALVIVTGAIFWIVRENSEMVAGASPGSASVTASVPTSRRRQIPPDQKLSLMDQLLVSLGVAEAPPTPTYNGNPDVRVWVDLHSALYYCPGSDMYGKTPKGKYTSQRDAQLDQFEPAYRKVCD